jgi:hypothetical protein
MQQVFIALVMSFALLQHHYYLLDNKRKTIMEEEESSSKKNQVVKHIIQRPQRSEVKILQDF